MLFHDIASLKSKFKSVFSNYLLIEIKLSEFFLIEIKLSELYLYTCKTYKVGLSVISHHKLEQKQ